MEKITYVNIINPAKEELEPVENGLLRYNQSQVGGEPDEFRRLLIKARAAQGDLAGGVFGEAYWDWVHVKTLWVDKRYRKYGIGAQLLARMERLARKEGYRGGCHLETTSFQALDFYRRLGYTVFGQIEGKPKGYIWYYLKKTFAE